MEACKFIALFMFGIAYAKISFANVDVDLVSSMCTQREMSIDAIKQISVRLSGLENFPRMQCGLPGEDLKVCKGCQEIMSEKQIALVRPMLNQAEHRNWHARWHDLRNLAAGESTDKTKTIQKAIEDKWIATANEVARNSCTRASGTTDPGPTKVGKFVDSSTGGETFLYMHREMIKMVNAKLISAGEKCVQGWTQIPEKVDNSIGLVGHPSDLRYASSLIPLMKDLDKQMTDTRHLEAVSLNQLGCEIETSLHVIMHQAWLNPEDPCADERNKFQEKCDSLGPPVSSPLNIHFWMLHGYIDSLVGKWLEKNGYNEISEDCSGRKQCYQWKGKWVGIRPKLTL